MSPNLQNVIRSDKDPRVPVLRDYIVPTPYYKAFAQRDFSQQELRLLAHYEDGPFLRSYMENPDQDGHVLVKGLIQETTGIVLDRRPVKDLNFGLIYGQGLALTAEKLRVPREEAKRLRNAHAQSLPGLPVLQDMLKERERSNEPIWTWGGRRYFCEKPKFIKGRLWTFGYKMLNKLIQGSAADVTKQAMINYDSLGRIAEENPMLLQVHDEMILGLAKSDVAHAMRVHCALRDAMLGMEGIAVPMKSDGKLGTKSWHQMKKIKW
jgi:DNA polymerase-1